MGPLNKPEAWYCFFYAIADKNSPYVSSCEMTEGERDISLSGRGWTKPRQNSFLWRSSTGSGKWELNEKRDV